MVGARAAGEDESRRGDPARGGERRGKSDPRDLHHAVGVMAETLPRDWRWRARWADELEREAATADDVGRLPIALALKSATCSPLRCYLRFGAGFPARVACGPLGRLAWKGRFDLFAAL
jgi:hypothetical protein